MSDPSDRPAAALPHGHGAEMRRGALAMLRSRKDVGVALVGGLGALALRGPLGAGPAILAAVVVAAVLVGMAVFWGPRAAGV